MPARQSSFSAIGTKWRIDAQTSLSDPEWGKLMERVAARIEEFDVAYSRFRDDSLVAQISRAAGQYELPPDGPRLVEFYRRLYDATDGLVTPLIGQVMADAGYDASYSFEEKPLAEPPAWDAVLNLSGRRLEVKQAALLDFGAAGKGYLVDIVGALLAAAGATVFCVNAGGDILR